MRLIDADALEEYLLNDSSCLTVFEAIRKTQSMPTVDAVPVVRCRDCRFYDDGTSGQGWWNWCHWWNRGAKETGYCHMGLRREDGKCIEP